MNVLLSLCWKSCEPCGSSKSISSDLGSSKRPWVQNRGTSIGWVVSQYTKGTCVIITILY